MVIGIIATLVGILAPVVAQARARGRDVVCLANLQDLAKGFHLYAANYDGHLPDDYAQEPWDELLRPWMPGDGVYRCPSDEIGMDQQVGLSYAWRDSFEVDEPRAALSGRKIEDVARPSELLMVFDCWPGWHGEDGLNAAAVDCSARCYTVGQWEANLLLPVK